MPWQIRHAMLIDAKAMQQIEILAGQLFAEHGMPEIASDAPPSLRELADYCEAGLAWVASRMTGPPVAYVVAKAVDQCLHIEQISVTPSESRQGIGRLLVEHVASEAPALGFECLTLTTFSEIPWNAPYYATLGFRILAETEWTEGLKTIRAQEMSLGLDRWPRICMRRELPPDAPRTH